MNMSHIGCTIPSVREWTPSNVRINLEHIVSEMEKMEHISREEKLRIVYTDDEKMFELYVDLHGYIVLCRHRRSALGRKPANRYVVLHQTEDFTESKCVKYFKKSDEQMSSFRTADGKIVYESAGTTLDIAILLAFNCQSEQKKWEVRHDTWGVHGGTRDDLYSMAYLAAYLSWREMPLKRRVGFDMVGRSTEVDEQLICTLATVVLMNEFTDLDRHLANYRTVTYWRCVKSLLDTSYWLDENDFVWMRIDDFGSHIVRKCMTTCTPHMTLDTVNASMRPGVQYFVRQFLTMTNLWTRLYGVDSSYVNRLLTLVN